MNRFTAREAAKQIGVSRAALYQWIISGKIEAPKLQPGSTRGWWLREDIERVKLARTKFLERRFGAMPLPSRRFSGASPARDGPQNQIESSPIPGNRARIRLGPSRLPEQGHFEALPCANQNALE